MFKDIQNYWMEFDYDNLKKLLTDELYNTYNMELETLKLKNQKNVMSGFELLSINLTDLKKENNQFIATVMLNVRFKDYIVDSSDKVIRGKENTKINNVYLLTFVKSVDENKNNICPKCGAEVSGNTTGICNYCGSKIVFNEFDWVMSKKQKISQR